MFGNKEYSTRLTFINDTVTYATKYRNKPIFGGFL